MRSAEIQTVLNNLNSSSQDIEASALISVDGLMMASALSGTMDEDLVSAMSAALLSLGERAGTELARGSLEQLLIQGESGYIVMSSAGAEAVLTILAKPKAKLGLVFLDMKRAAKKLTELLAG